MPRDVRLFGAAWRALAVVLAVLGAGAARADTVTLIPAADNTIYEDSDLGTNGGGSYIFIGRNGGGYARRTLIKFDFSSIPAGSTITSASLRLYVSRTHAANSTGTLYRLTNSWGEGTSTPGGNEGQGIAASPGDATWVYRFFDYDAPVSWATPGGDRVAGASAATTVGGVGSTPIWASATMASDVQGWLNSPGTNFGWILIGLESGATTTHRFNSRSNATVNTRPQLTVVYTPPANTGACCIPASGCAIMTATACASAGGTYQGNGTSCSPDPCPPPTGACCLSSGVCVVVTQSQCASQGGTYQGDGVACGAVSCPIQLTPFVDALPIPAVAQPTTGQAGGEAHYDIAMTEFQQKLHRDLPMTTVWGYEHSFPGPTIEARRDLPVTVTWTNDLRVLATQQLRTTHYFPVDLCLHGPDINGPAPMTTVHLHGAHVGWESDGYPEYAYPPGESSPLYTYPNHQPATMLWYHDHGLGITRLNVYMGLAGAYILRDAGEDALNLPGGEYEVPLVIMDKSFNPDGSLKYHNTWLDHFFGDFILVNGKVWPYMNVKRGKYRFRVLNGSNSRTYTLGLSDNAPLVQLSSDTGLLAAPAPRAKITLSPAERADIVIDFSSYAPGTEIVLTNSAPAPFPGVPGVGVVPNVMKFIVGSQTGDTDPLPATLASVPRIPEAEAVQHRDFLLRETPDTRGCDYPTMWTINGMMWNDITEYPVLGTTEVWSWINRSDVVHPMHMHMVSFQVLDRQDFEIVNDQVVPVGSPVTPGAGEMGWKDTVQCYPFQITRVIARFEDYPGRFPYHCHILEHEDNEMMRQFEVCDPARVAAAPGDAETCYGGDVSFGAAGAGTSLSFAWTHDGQPVSDGATPSGSVVSGAATETLGISGVTYEDGGLYRVTVSNQCGTQTSEAARLSVCPADFNCSGGTPDDADVAAFFVAWNNGDAGADANGSGGTPDDADIAYFFNVWNNGGC